jgi:hypothetical protein
LRTAAWLATDIIPRGVFGADLRVYSEALGKNVTVSDFTIDKALGELARFSLIRLTGEAISVHRLLQAVEQDSLTKVEGVHWLECAIRLFDAFV